LVNYLLDGLSDLPVVIGLSARPEFVEAFPDFGATSTPPLRLQLLHLSKEDKLHLIASIVGAEPEELPAWVVSLCEQFSESTPRAMVELLRLLVETQVLSWQPGVGERSLLPVWDEERRSQIELPSSLPGVVEARLLAMAEGSRRLLEYAAVAGENFHLGALLTLSRCEASGLTSTEPADSDGPSLTEVQDGDSERLAELSELIEQLIGQGVLMAVPTSQLNVERELRFAYPPWQKTIYEQVESERKRRYHLLLAQFLQLQPDSDREDLQQRIARHFERAGDGPLAALAYERAAELSVRHGATGRAPRLLLRGLAGLSSEQLADRLRLWQQLGRVLSLLGDLDAALSAWEKVVRLAFVLASRKERAQAFLEMGRIVAHDPGRALGFLQRALELFQQLQDQVGIADTLDEEGQAMVWLGKQSEGMDRLAQALEMRRRLLDRKKVAMSLLHVGRVEYQRGALDAAVACFDEAQRKHEDDPLLQAAAMTALGSVDLARGDVGAARARFEEALPLCERSSPSKEQVTLLCYLGDSLLRDGLLSEAESRLIQARDLAQRLLDQRGLAESKRLLGLIQLRRGDKKKALELCQSALERAQQSGLRSLIAQSLLSLGEIHADTLFDETVEGEHPAWDYLKRAVALLREGGDQIELAQGLAAFGKLLVERRKLGPGRAALREASQLAARLRMKLHDELEPLLHDLGG
jgi:tetratricopeptide (TPR) repeat protein